MPKVAASAVPAIARAAGEVLGLSEDAIEAVYHQRVLLPGQQRILSVDPGDKHVGMAVGLAFARPPSPDVDGRRDAEASDELIVAFEIGRLDGLTAVDTAVCAGWVDVLIIEDWQIYRDKAAELVGSRCETARFLGAVEHIVHKYNRWAIQVEMTERVRLVEQPASVQAVAKQNLARYGVERTSRRDQPHALSAELHWWYHVLAQRRLIDQ